MPAVDKKDVFEALRLRLLASLEQLTAAQKSAQAGATHPDNKQEHAKDMRSTEASYLARGLAERVETLRDGIRAFALLQPRPLDVAAPGALVELEDEDGDATIYLLAPAGGGETLELDGVRVLVLTPQSPLGAAIAGRGEGDSVEVELPAGRRRLELVKVS